MRAMMRCSKVQAVKEEGLVIALQRGVLADSLDDEVATRELRDSFDFHEANPATGGPFSDCGG